MQQRHLPTYIRYRIGAGFIILLVGFFGWYFVFNHSVQNTISPQTQRTEQAFAVVPANSLDATQRRILTLLKQEYTKSPMSYDKTVLTYTEGFKESWCADFITWIMNEADSTIINPDTDYWRVPGVLTLQQYYKNNEAYVLANSGYSPQLGDVVFYIGSQTPDNSSGEHAALVLGITPDQKLITIGGNEADGILRIRTESIKENVSKGMVGYGKLYI